MTYKEHRESSPHSVSFAVLTISDTRTEEDDDSGKAIKSKLTENGHRVASYAILKDDKETIKETVEELLDEPEVQVILTNGGTGVSHRDVTIEAVSPLLEKTLDGFGEIFRSLSFQEIGTAAVLSRAIAGAASGKVVICIPGSPGAVSTALDGIIIPEIGHMVREVSR